MSIHDDDQIRVSTTAPRATTSGITLDSLKAAMASLPPPPPLSAIKATWPDFLKAMRAAGVMVLGGHPRRPEREPHRLIDPPPDYLPTGAYWPGGGPGRGGHGR